MDDDQQGKPGKRREDRPNALLREAIDALDCNYALFDTHRRLIDYNRAYFELHRDTLEAFGQPLSGAGLAGSDVTYDDLMRGAIRRSLPGATPAEIEAELGQRRPPRRGWTGR